MKLFIGSLPRNIIEFELSELGRPFCYAMSVERLSVISPENLKAYGFVETPNRSMGDKVIEELNGKMNNYRTSSARW